MIVREGRNIRDIQQADPYLLGCSVRITGPIQGS